MPPAGGLIIVEVKGRLPTLEERGVDGAGAKEVFHALGICARRGDGDGDGDGEFNTCVVMVMAATLLSGSSEPKLLPRYLGT